LSTLTFNLSEENMFQEVNKNKNLLLTSPGYINQKEYWVKKLSGDLTKTTLSVNGDINGCEPGKRLEKVEIHFSSELFHTLMKLSQNTVLSLYLILLTSLKSLIYHYTGNEDIIVISPPYKMNISGDTLNDHLYIRQQNVARLTFKELLLELRQSVFEAYDNQDYPFDDLIDSLYSTGQIQDNKSYSNIECLLQNIHDYNDRDYEDIKGRLVFSFLREDSQIKGHISYNPVIYDKFYIEQVSRHFVRILECAVEDVNIYIPGILFLSLEEREQLIHDFNKTETEYRKDKLTHERFEEQAIQTPDRIAAVYEDFQVSYGYLNKKSRKLAHLLQKKGVRPDTIVGIMVERTLEMLVGIWGVLQAGGAYLPIDPDYPGDRIKCMLEDSRAEGLLTLRTLFQKIKFDKKVIYLDDDPGFADCSVQLAASTVTPVNLAYIIYTSGSTGVPKGVLIQHQNLLAYIEAFYKEFEISSEDTAIQQASYSFDAFVEEVYPVLLRGGRLVIPNKNEIVDFDILSELIAKHRVNIISCSPLLLSELNRVNSKNSIHTYISGGDVLKTEYIDNLLKTGKVYNTYGPTETTVCVTYYRCSPTPGVNISIGKSISNYQVYILGKNDQLLPIGVMGELCVSGGGMARGYLNRPELTGEKFFHHPFIEGERIYRTGDIARWLPDGNIEFRGRLDQQVKIRGYRIELGEIERRLRTREEIKDVVVVAGGRRIDGEKGEQLEDRYICAYIVADREFEISELREHMSRKLPDYLIPSYFMQIESIPLNPNGKVDMKALPAPRIVAGEDYKAPRDEIEEKLVGLWTEVLFGKESSQASLPPGQSQGHASMSKMSIGIDSNFFHLGGHSLKATILASKIHRAFHVKLTLAEIFKTPTIREIARYIKNSKKEEYAAIEKAQKKDYYELSPSQKGLYILQQLDEASTAYNMPLISKLNSSIDKRRLEDSFMKLIERHESLRTTFVAIDGHPLQKIYNEVDFAIEHYEGNEEIVNEIYHSFIRPFDLRHAPLMRAGLLETVNKERWLMVDMHHIISDGVSIDILQRDFTAIYEGNELPPLRLQYKDYSEWRDNIFGESSELMQKQEAFWLKQFENETPVLNLPTDFPRPIIKVCEGDQIYFSIGKDLSRKVRRISRETGATLNMVLLAVYYILLSKYSNQEDIIIGSPVFGRKHVDLLEIIGLFVNMLALRNQPRSDKTFREFLMEIRLNVIKAMDNQDYHFGQLTAKLGLQGNTGKNPLFDVVFNMGDMDSGQIKNDAAGRKAKPGKTQNASAPTAVPFDLVLAVVKFEDTLEMRLDYSVVLFKRVWIEKFTKRYVEILKQVTAAPDIKIKDVSISHNLVFLELKNDKGESNFAF
jgi:amino acid adenylation domain-containing protein